MDLIPQIPLELLSGFLFQLFFLLDLLDFKFFSYVLNGL